MSDNNSVKMCSLDNEVVFRCFPHSDFMVKSHLTHQEIFQSRLIKPMFLITNGICIQCFCFPTIADTQGKNNKLPNYLTHSWKTMLSCLFQGNVYKEMKKKLVRILNSAHQFHIRYR